MNELNPDPSRKIDWRTFLVLPVFLLGLLAVYLLYQPALDAPVLYDTESNLAGVNSAVESGQARTWILTGEAGPLGRPIALATFVAEAEAWPDDPGSLRHTNVLIHLLNGLLLAWAAFLILRAVTGKTRESAWAGVLAAMIWLLSPLLASTNLIIIQRMTSLATLFMLAGVVAHMHLRTLVATRPVAGYIAISFSLGVFTLLATLTKENGALLPGMILVLEFFVLSKPQQANPKHWRLWQGIFLLAPLLLIAGYVLSRWSYPENTLLMRDFNAWERLMTQAVVLWEYLFHTLVPAMHRLGPFHDGYAAYRSFWDLPVLLAVAGWLAAIFVAIRFRRQLPMLSFAIGWYLVGHLLESTVIPLELYFEHRNYLPLIGPAIALSWGLVFAVPHLRRLLVTGAVFYMLVCGFVLFRTAMLWDHGLDGAQFWQEHNPDSQRAALFLTERLMQEGDLAAVLMNLQQRQAPPGQEAVQHLFDTGIRCYYGFPADDDFLFTMKDKLDHAAFSYALIRYVGGLYEMARDWQCSAYSEEDIVDLAREMLDRERLAGVTYTRYSLNALLGNIMVDRGQYAKAATYFEHSLAARKDPQNLFRAVASHLEAGQYAEGCRMIANMHANPPERRMTREIWQDALTIYEQDIATAADMASCQEVLDSEGSNR